MPSRQCIWSIVLGGALLLALSIRVASAKGEPAGAPRFDAEAIKSLERMND